MKKIMVRLLMVMTMFAIFGSISFVASQNEVSAKTKLYIERVSHKKYLKLHWYPTKNEKIFIVYKKKSTQKKYKKIARIKIPKSNELVFCDKNILLNKKYNYKIVGLKNKNKIISVGKINYKAKLSSIRITPKDEEGHCLSTYISNGRVVMGIVYNEGDRIKGKVELYRKGEGEKKFRKLKSSEYYKEEKLDEDGIYPFVDKSALDDCHYKYKARVYLKQGKKKYYSAFSNTVKYWHVNGVADFKVEKISEGTLNDRKYIVIGVSNNTYPNGNLCVDGGKGLNTEFIEYSYDCKNWKDMKGKVVKFTNRDDYIYFKVISDELLTSARVDTMDIGYQGPIENPTYYYYTIDLACGRLYTTELDDH